LGSCREACLPDPQAPLWRVELRRPDTLARRVTLRLLSSRDWERSNSVRSFSVDV